MSSIADVCIGKFVMHIDLVVRVLLFERRFAKHIQAGSICRVFWQVVLSAFAAIDSIS